MQLALRTGGDDETRVSFSPFPADGQRIVCGLLHIANRLEVAEGLAGDGLQALRQVWLVLVAGDDDGEERHLGHCGANRSGTSYRR